jgi:hypothetical protein
MTGPAPGQRIPRATGSSGRYRKAPNDAVDELIELKKRVEVLESALRAGWTNIGTGTLQADGGTIRARDHVNAVDNFYVGALAGGGYGVLMYGANGNQIYNYQSYSPTDTATDDKSWQWYDPQGHILVGSDGLSQKGLARPWIPISVGLGGGATQAADTATPWLTTSGSFVTLATMVFIKQQPRMDFYYHQATTSAAGIFQLVDVSDASVLWSTTTGLGSGFQVEAVPFAIPGEHMDLKVLNLNGRVSSGAGHVAIIVDGAWQMQS